MNHLLQVFSLRSFRISNSSLPVHSGWARPQVKVAGAMAKARGQLGLAMAKELVMGVSVQPMDASRCPTVQTDDTSLATAWCLRETWTHHRVPSTVNAHGLDRTASHLWLGPPFSSAQSRHCWHFLKAAQDQSLAPSDQCLEMSAWLTPVPSWPFFRQRHPMAQ